MVDAAAIVSAFEDAGYRRTAPRRALAELGGRPEDVIRTRHFITDGDAELVDAVSTVHGEIFGEIRPASTMVVVAGLIDPRWKVEVELDAVVAE